MPRLPSIYIMRPGNLDHEHVSQAPRHTPNIDLELLDPSVVSSPGLVAAVVSHSVPCALTQYMDALQ